ncbi:MAG: non-canonical purine NTP pyrophosphatase [Acidobacteria bacterium]|nr:non-canonical purine NTP pyrophosphatase [Acidobacteriota bacterium]
MISIHVASSNRGKIAELMLGARLWAKDTEQGCPWNFESLPGLEHLPQCEEDGESFAANAAKKALHYSPFTDGLVLADDSGIEVDALGSAPGIYSARFAGPNAADAENNAKLLAQMQGVPARKRTARFVCELALAQHGQLLARFRGVAEGTLLEAPRGSGGFGYDPLFFDPELNRTFAELSPEEKLHRSHRGKSLRALLDWLAGNIASFSKSP